MDPQREAGLRELWSELGMDEGSFETHLSRGTAFRGLLRALSKLGHFDAVAADVPEMVAAVMHDPPLGAAWVSDVVFYCALQSTHRIVSETQFREVARQSMWSGPIEVMRPFIEGMLRLFNASPHGLLSRVPQIMNQHMKGAVFTYDKISETGAHIGITQALPGSEPTRGEVNRVYWEEVLCCAVELCKRTRERVESRAELEGQMLRTSLRLSWN